MGNASTIVWQQCCSDTAVDESNQVMVAATRINSVFTPENVDGSIVQREKTDGGAPASSNGCPMVNIN